MTPAFLDLTRAVLTLAIRFSFRPACQHEADRSVCSTCLGNPA